MTRESKMDVLHPRELLDLVAQSHPPCVSLYLPTHRRAPTSREDALGLRRLLDDARTDLREIGLRSAEIDDLLGPASSLLADRVFWGQRLDGLAILLAADRWQCLRLPFPVPELVTVGERFSIHRDELIVRAEVPGVDVEKDVDITVSDHLRVLNAELVRALRLSSAETEEVAAREQAEWNAACSAAGGGRPAVDLQDRTVIVVDDGIATGSKLGRAGR
jgi:hypothetical protein